MPMERYTSTTSIPYYVYTHSFKELAVPGYMHALPSGPLVPCARSAHRHTGTMWSIKRSTTGAHL